MKSPMQILQGRNARSDLLMSNAARKQLSIQPEVDMNNNKHAVLPMHYLHVVQNVMYHDSTSKHGHPAVIQSLCFEPRSYKIFTRDGFVYRKTQSHLKPFTPQNKNSTLAASETNWAQECKVTFSFSCYSIFIDGTTPIDLKKNPENISHHRQAFAAQHGSFLRSEGNVYPMISFWNVHLYNIIIIVLIGIDVKCQWWMLLFSGTDVKTCLDVVSVFYSSCDW